MFCWRLRLLAGAGCVLEIGGMHDLPFVILYRFVVGFLNVSNVRTDICVLGFIKGVIMARV